MARIQLFFFLVTIGVAFSQDLYLDSLFSEINESTEIYFSKGGEDLKVDIFDPVENDDKKPMILYVHGGGFAGGRRDHPNHIDFCAYFASRGYLTATMSYTLQMKGKSFGCDQPAPNKIQTFLLTARDISRAARFFIDHSEEYNINPGQIILVGSSAGAEAILHAGFWKETWKDDEGEILPADFSYAGLIPMAGAITNLKWITAETAIPTQLFHGTCDNLVPYGTAPHHYCAAEDPGFLMLYGSGSVADRLQEFGKGYYLVTGCFGRHEWNSLPLRKYRSEIADFLYTDVLQQKNRQIHLIEPSENKDPCVEYNSFNFCTN